MVAPAEHNLESTRGTFGEPIRRTCGFACTAREYQALKRKAGFNSVSKVLRSLIPAGALQSLVEETEAAAAKPNSN